MIFDAGLDIPSLQQRKQRFLRAAAGALHSAGHTHAVRYARGQCCSCIDGAHLTAGVIPNNEKQNRKPTHAGKGIRKASALASDENVDAHHMRYFSDTRMKCPLPNCEEGIESLGSIEYTLSPISETVGTGSRMKSCFFVLADCFNVPILQPGPPTP